jgi:Domain of unknown function (DU1801)
MSRVFSDPQVEAAFHACPALLRGPLLNLRDIIFSTAAGTARVGKLIETLKWGQPAYLPAQPRTGSTIRIGALKGAPNNYAAFFHCQTTLVSTFRQLHRDELSFEGNRAIVFSVDHDLPTEAFRHCVSLALTYHRRPAA